MKLGVYAGKEGKPTGLSNSSNLIRVFERDGCKVVQLGDSGIIVDEVTLSAIGGTDVVIVNVDNCVMPRDKIMGFMAKIGARYERPWRLRAALHPRG